MNFQDLADGQTIKSPWYTYIGTGAGRMRKCNELTMTRKDDRLWLRFPFNKKITEEIKACMAGYKWHGFEEPPIKQWSIKHCAHNWFQLNFFAGENPYGPYDADLVVQDFDDRVDIYGETVKPFKHQKEMASQFLQYHYTLLACEMGTGKTLAAIMAMERTQLTDWAWIAPRSALHSVEVEFKRWKTNIRPKFLTYSQLKKHNEEWEPGRPIYQGIILDEISRCKNYVAQRTVASQYLADAVRREWGLSGFVIGMSGSPAPKSPVDWYSLGEIACPGFFKEGHVNVFKNNLAVIHKRESVTGGVYPQLVTWLDDENKCKTCGQFKDHECHDTMAVFDPTDEDCPYHAFKPSVNEVARLSRRMKGLVMVKMKKDCLDLPEKQYVRLKTEPSKSIIRAAKLIAATAGSTIKVLTLLRQLSDGFQYLESEVGKETCGVCKGQRVVDAPHYIGPTKTWEFLESIKAIPSWIDPNFDANPEAILIDPSVHPDYYKWESMACMSCHGSGEVISYARTVESFDCPKDDLLSDLLDQHDDVGRIVIFGGFTGSIDHCTELVVKAGWDFIRVDGRGWHSSIGGNPMGMLEAFQKHQIQWPRIAFIGQPGAAGMGLNLTASPSIVYFSNDFNAESRIQSEDRIHRPGMDVNRGATIYDLIHLPTDEYVLENLIKKRKLQSMSLGEIQEQLKYDD